MLYSITNAQVTAIATGTPQVVSDTEIAFFESQIAPILRRRCFKCHSHEAGKAKGGLVLDSRHGWEKGGSKGAVIVPGRPEQSLLIEAVRYKGLKMPPDDRPSCN